MLSCPSTPSRRCRPSFGGGTLLVMQPLHMHQHTRAARARKSANMVSANMVSILPKRVPRRRSTSPATSSPSTRAPGRIRTAPPGPCHAI